MAALFFDTAPLFGQGAKLPGGVDRDPLEALINRPSTRTPGQPIALEEAIDPGRYRLGPGDQLEFAIWGIVELHFDLMVAPDGTVSVPSVGGFRVAERTLAEADSVLKSAALVFYPRSRIELRLTGIRTRRLAIAGAVQAPGLYDLPAVERLSTLIQQAGGFVTATPPTSSPQSGMKQRSSEPEAKSERSQVFAPGVASKRRVIIEHRNGSRSRVDFLRFLKLGDREFNPVLADGDRVSVAMRDSTTGVVEVLGAVGEPGFLEWLPGDRLGLILDLAGGVASNADRSAVRVVRHARVQAGRTDTTLNLDQGGSDFAVEAEDRIYVRKTVSSGHRYRVEVSGEVQHPGFYPIDPGRTRLSEVLTSAGSMTEWADTMKARVVRQPHPGLAEDGEFERLRDLQTATLSAVEYGFVKARWRQEEPVVTADFVGILRGSRDALDPVLEDGDRIEVPLYSGTIRIIGQVARPGYSQWRPGYRMEDYIAAAGGYLWNANKGAVRIIKSESGAWVKPGKSVKIEAGDTIVIPDKRELSAWETWKEVLLAISQVATVLIVIRSF